MYIRTNVITIGAGISFYNVYVCVCVYHHSKLFVMVANYDSQQPSNWRMYTLEHWQRHNPPPPYRKVGLNKYSEYKLDAVYRTQFESYQRIYLNSIILTFALFIYRTSTSRKAMHSQCELYHLFAI